VLAVLHPLVYPHSPVVVMRHHNIIVIISTCCNKGHRPVETLCSYELCMCSCSAAHIVHGLQHQPLLAQLLLLLPLLLLLQLRLLHVVHVCCYCWCLLPLLIQTCCLSVSHPHVEHIFIR
jgi:hypothetical protein